MKLQRVVFYAVGSFLTVTEGVLAQSVPFSINNFQNSPAQESITTPDGVTCTQNVNSRTSLQAGLYGIDSSQTSTNIQSFSTNQTPNFGAFVAIVVPLSTPPSTDCGEFAAIELERARLRLQREKEQFEEEKALRTNLRPQETQNPFFQNQDPAPSTQPPAVVPAPAPPAPPQSLSPRPPVAVPSQGNTASNANLTPVAPPIPVPPQSATGLPAAAIEPTAPPIPGQPSGPSAPQRVNILVAEEVIPTAPPIPVGYIPANPR